MAKLMSRSGRITKLDVSNTKISGVGLRALCKMSQLTSLDLWANNLSINDLENLRGLPRLDYLSIGNAHGYDDYDPEQVVQLLLSLPALKRVWLDGITLSDLQRAKLSAVIGEVRC
jgi:Leucine rich repeat